MADILFDLLFCYFEIMLNQKKLLSTVVDAVVEFQALCMEYVYCMR